MADDGAAGLCRHRVRRAHPVAAGVAAGFYPAGPALAGRLRHHDGRRVRHHHQPLPVFLAGLAGSRRHARRAATDALSAPAARAEAKLTLARIKTDTLIGMGFSNLVAFCIMLTTALTLHVHGITDIASSAEAAQALRPIAGEFAFLLFSMGIVGTGL